MPIKDDETDCLCRACLSEAIQKKMVDKLSHLTLAEKISLARGYKTKVKAIEGIDYNMEKGKYVFTQWHHLKRGACCNHKCKLCPY